MTYKLVLFDLDGTLVDTSAGYIRAFQQLLVAHDQTPMDDDSIRETISAGSRTTISQSWSHDLQPEQIEALRLDFLQRYENLSSMEAEAYPGIPALLHQLKSRGCLLGVVTNKTQRLVPGVLKETGLEPYLDLVVCPEQVSQIKPDPEGIQQALRTLEVAEEHCVYVGDHKKDVDAAHAAGVASAAVAYGFIPQSDHPSQWGARYTAERPHDLCQLLLKLTTKE